MATLDIAELQAQLRRFSAARDWERFHTPKNLAMALVGEAGELAAVLQWAEGSEAVAAVAEGGDLRGDFADEMADVMIYLARLADVAASTCAQPSSRRWCATSTGSRRSARRDPVASSAEDTVECGGPCPADLRRAALVVVVELIPRLERGEGGDGRHYIGARRRGQHIELECEVQA